VNVARALIFTAAIALRNAKSKTSKRSTTTVSEEKPRAKSTKTQAKSGTSPKIKTQPRSESVATPAPTSTPSVPPSLESSPSP